MRDNDTVYDIAKIEAEYCYEVGQRDAEGNQFCGSKKAGWPHDPTPCQSRHLYPNGRCKKHGGPTPSGLAHHNLKHGSYSRYLPHLPTRMAGSYEVAMLDDDPHDLRPELHLLTAMIEDAIGKLHLGESGQWIVRVQRAVKRFDTAVSQADEAGIIEAAQKMREVVSSGVSYAEAVGEIAGLIEQKRKTAETDSRRQRRAEDIFTKEKAWLMLGFIDSALHEAVYAHADGKLARKILTDYSKRIRQLIKPITDVPDEDEPIIEVVD